MSRSRLLLLITLSGGVLFAQPAPDPAVEVTQSGGQPQLILRNIHNVPVQAYLIEVGSRRGAQLSQWGIFDSLGNNPIAPNATIDVSPLDTPTEVRIAVVYTDGSIVGNKVALRQLLAMRAEIRRSIPFAERALREAASRERTLPELIRAVEKWRRDPGYLLFAELSREGRSQRPSGGAQVGMCRVHQRRTRASRNVSRSVLKCRSAGKNIKVSNDKFACMSWTFANPSSGYSRRE